MPADRSVAVGTAESEDNSVDSIGRIYARCQRLRSVVVDLAVVDLYPIVGYRPKLASRIGAPGAQDAGVRSKGVGIRDNRCPLVAVSDAPGGDEGVDVGKAVKLVPAARECWRN